MRVTTDWCEQSQVIRFHFILHIGKWAPKWSAWVIISVWPGRSSVPFVIRVYSAGKTVGYIKWGNQIDEIDCDAWRRRWMKDGKKKKLRRKWFNTQYWKLSLNWMLYGERKKLRSLFSAADVVRVLFLFFHSCSLLLGTLDIQYPLVSLRKFIYEFFSPISPSTSGIVYNVQALRQVKGLPPIEYGSRHRISGVQVLISHLERIDWCKREQSRNVYRKKRTREKGKTAQIHHILVDSESEM